MHYISGRNGADRHAFDRWAQPRVIAMETRLFINGRYEAARGGARQSGFGRQGGRHSLEFWTEPKLICMTYPEDNANG